MTPNRTNRRLAVRHWLLALAAMVFCCQCKTSEGDNVIKSIEEGSRFGKLGKLTPVGDKKQGGYQFVDDHQNKKSKKKGGASDRIAKRDQSPIYNKDGDVVRWEKKADLYDDRSAITASETGRSFNGKKSSEASKKFKTSEFKTPEYIQRQEYSGNKKFKADTARESGSENKAFRKLFQADSNSSSDKLAKENGSRVSGYDKTYATRSDPVGRKAQKNSALATGTARSNYSDNVGLTIDDVKKMVSPSSIR